MTMVSFGLISLYFMPRHFIVLPNADAIMYVSINIDHIQKPKMSAAMAYFSFGRSLDKRFAAIFCLMTALSIWHIINVTGTAVKTRMCFESMAAA